MHSKPGVKAPGGLGLDDCADRMLGMLFGLVRGIALVTLAVLMLGFTAILSVGIPELWLHPFGPLTKNVPLIAATLVMIALEE